MFGSWAKGLLQAAVTSALSATLILSSTAALAQQPVVATQGPGGSSPWPVKGQASNAGAGTTSATNVATVSYQYRWNGSSWVQWDGSTTISGSQSNAAGGTTGAANVPTMSYSYVWNGSSWVQSTIGTAGSPSAQVVTVQAPTSGGTTMPVADATVVTALGAATPAGTNHIGSTNTDQVNGVTILTGAGATGTGSARTTVAQDATTIAGAPPSSTILQHNAAQVNGVTTSTGAGAVGTGSQRIAVGQDTTTIAGSAPGTAGTPSANMVSVQGKSGMTPIVTAPTTAASTQVLVTLGSAGVFSSALASAAGRNACVIQNTSSDVELLFFGATGSATTTNSIQLQPGQSVGCSLAPGVTATDNVAMAGQTNASDTVVVISQ